MGKYLDMQTVFSVALALLLYGVIAKMILPKVGINFFEENA